jgi:hypothetical protein
VAVSPHDGRSPRLGAYLCIVPGEDRPQPECLAAATRRGGFARALRAKVTLDRKLVESVNR